MATATSDNLLTFYLDDHDTNMDIKMKTLDCIGQWGNMALKTMNLK